MLTTRKRSLLAAVEGGGDAMASLYENSRIERIKDNMERMKKLGILQLSLNLKSECRKIKPGCAPRTVSHSASGKLPSPAPPPRRSSRLQNVAPIQYSETQSGREEKSMADDRLDWVGDGQREEIYSEEHEKLLGSCEMDWNLFVDGYDNSGKRIYDQVRGKTCHQCRQKTLGHRTSCIQCNLVQGQFCGDCLYMRYGENVLEVQKNPNWTCPVCRGICNCSLCRVKKGWSPTGALYKRVKNHGYKSVAHYLILTRRGKSADMKSTESSFPTKLQGSTNANFDGKHETLEEEEVDEVELAVKSEGLEVDDTMKLAVKLETFEEEEDKGILVVKPEMLKKEEDKWELAVKLETVEEEEDKGKLVVKLEMLKKEEEDKGELTVKLKTREEDTTILAAKHQAVKEEEGKGELAVKLETVDDYGILAVKQHELSKKKGKGTAVKLETEEKGKLAMKLEALEEEDKGTRGRR